MTVPSGNIRAGRLGLHLPIPRWKGPTWPFALALLVALVALPAFRHDAYLFRILTTILIWSTLFYTLIIALLMISRLPVYSGKRVGTRVPPEMVGPVIVIIVLSIGLLIAYPWIVLTLGTLAYLGSLPFGWLSYRRYQQRSREPVGEGIREGTRETMLGSSPVGGSSLSSSEQAARPSRLN